MTRTISIIIPTLNEQESIGTTLSSLLDKKNCEVIIVDGGSCDRTLALVQKAGFRVISSPRGRGRQMNIGAAAATGEVLLFLHADTLIPNNFRDLIFNAASRPAFAAGAFSLAIDSPKKGLAAIAWFTNLRSRFLHLPYGDQALFTTRRMFNAVGGFPEVEIMEDFVFIQKMKKKGKIITLPERAMTSARRWQNVGIVRTTCINQLIVCGYSLGLSSATLAKWYQRMRGVGKQV